MLLTYLVIIVAKIFLNQANLSPSSLPLSPSFSPSLSFSPLLSLSLSLSLSPSLPASFPYSLPPSLPLSLLVFLTSLKPQGGSIIQVTVFPSDFGLERIKNEDLQGPTELINQSDHSNDMTSTELINQSDHSNDMTSQEGPGYSNECLRKYQLQRLNYYYAVVECDSKGQIIKLDVPSYDCLSHLTIACPIQLRQNMCMSSVMAFSMNTVVGNWI